MSTWTGKDKDNDNDNDLDQTFCQVSVQKALTCPEGQSARALAPSLIGERKLAPCRKLSSRYSCSDLVPRGILWACLCAGS